MFGLGYLGLPLAVAYFRKYPVINFDAYQNSYPLIKSSETIGEILNK
jgi:UDP-N-acetyl-D-mannosaminuronate dehydrogenase